MKQQRLLGALCAGLILHVSPAMAAEQSSTVMPTSGPMSMASFAGKVNDGIRAIMSCSWGSSAPANGPSAAPIAYQCWADTTTNPVVFKRYDGTSWVTFGALDTTAHSWTPYRQGLPLAAVATSASAADLTTGTLPAARLPNPSASALGGVQSKSCSSGNWLNQISTGGVPGCSQPSFADLTGSIAGTQLPALSGDVSTSAGGTVTAIGAGKVTNSMLAGSIVASKLVGTDIATVGTITTGVWAGTTLAVGHGGTNATSPARARSNLGLVIGTDVQAWDADLDAFALKTAPTGDVVGTTDFQSLTSKTINCGSNTCTVRISNDVTGLGTGVATALAANVGSAGAPVVNGGALGTPLSGVATNLTGTAAALTAGHVTTNANLTGDVSSSGNATTLATVNANTGSFGSAAAVPTFTVNGKGLITAASSSAYQNGTNAQKGVVQGDGTTITCVSGVCTSLGGAASSVGVGTTTVSTSTSGNCLYNDAGTLGDRPCSKVTTVQRLTSGSGTYTPTSADVRWIRVRLVGGGGGGCGANASSGQTDVGSGGGGGGYVEDIRAAGSFSYTVGAGGAAQTNGGDTTFDNLTAGGGKGTSFNTGAGTTASRASGSGSGGPASGGNIANIPGGSGEIGFRYSGGDAISARGGASFMSNMSNQAVGSNGPSGLQYGGGGGGAASVAVAGTGGPGADGVIFVEEHY